LSNGVVIEVHPARFRSLRGYTTIGCVLDEIGFWFTEDAVNPDHEVVAALKPSMATIPGGMLVGLSSPYRRAGTLFDSYRQHFGKDGEVLVVQSDSLTMNPTLSQKIIDRAYQQDSAAARSEYGGLFRDDLAAFVDANILQSVIPSGLTRRHYIKGQTYKAFCDPSGGGGDAFTLCIGHLEDGMPVLDLIEEWKPPFSPDSVVKEYSALIKEYGIRQVTGDRYSGQFVQELFRKNQVTYLVSKLNRSELYLELLPLINSGNVSLLDNQTLITQLCNLERRTTSVGRDMIDHCRGGHDDLSNSCAGVMAQLTKVHEEKMINIFTGVEITPADWQWSKLTVGNIL